MRWSATWLPLPPRPPLSSPAAVASAHVALVTGGSRGIGRAITLELVRRGIHVAIVYRERAEAAAETALLAAGLPGQVRAYRADVRVREEMAQAYQEAERDLGTPDILVNNASIVRDGLFTFLKEEDWDAVYETAVKGAFHACKLSLMGMLRKRWGRIVNIISNSALSGLTGQTQYSAAKGALAAFTRSLARETATYGVTVNAVSPGFIDTEILGDIPPEKMKAYLNEIPMKRLGTPTEAAALVGFLVSEEASYITGQTMIVDGGLRM